MGDRGGLTRGLWVPRGDDFSAKPPLNRAVAPCNFAIDLFATILATPTTYQHAFRCCCTRITSRDALEFRLLKVDWCSCMVAYPWQFKSPILRHVRSEPEHR